MGAMSTRMSQQLRYDAPNDAVSAMLVDPAFREAVCERQHVVRSEISIETDYDAGGEGARVTIDRWQRTSGVPAFAKKVVGEETNIVQRELWTSRRLGDVTVAIPGKPGDMTGTLRLDEQGGSTVQSIELEIKVGIPLVGGKLESLIADLLRKAYQVEEQVGRDYLSARA